MNFFKKIQDLQGEPKKRNAQKFSNSKNFKYLSPNVP